MSLAAVYKRELVYETPAANDWVANGIREKQIGPSPSSQLA